MPPIFALSGHYPVSRVDRLGTLRPHTYVRAVEAVCPKNLTIQERLAYATIATIPSTMGLEKKPFGVRGWSSLFNSLSLYTRQRGIILNAFA